MSMHISHSFVVGDVHVSSNSAAVVSFCSFYDIFSDWPRAAQAPLPGLPITAQATPRPANHRSDHALIGSRSHAHIRVGLSRRGAAQRPPAGQAAVAPLKCLHLVTVGGSATQRRAWYR